MKKAFNIRFLKNFQTCWISCLFLFSIIYLNKQSIISISFLIITFIFFLSTICMHFNKKWAFVASLFFHILISMILLAYLLLNLTAFIMGYAPYRDSPASLFVVFIISTPFLLPAFFLIWLNWVNWINWPNGQNEITT